MSSAMDVHYELYALRQGRWVMDACFAEQGEAQTAAMRLKRAVDVRGVRLMRELSLPGATEPVATVVYDSTQEDAPLMFKPAEPAPAAKAPSKPVVVHHVPPHHRLRLIDEDEPTSPPESSPWVAYTLGATGFATAAAIVFFALV